MPEEPILPSLMDDLPESGRRVICLVQAAYALGEPDDVPIQDVVDDLLLAAASIMVVVHKSAGGPICPPMSGREKIDSARHAVSELAESMLGEDHGEPS